MNEPPAGPLASVGGDGPAHPRPPLDPARAGPLDRATADAHLAAGNDQLDSGDLAAAAAQFQRVVGTRDADQTAAALFGLATALYRLDADDQARATYEQILALPETRWTYRAWRELAAMGVRDGDLHAAQKAYREAERRAPADDRAAIQSRLGWLAKELGDTRQASRYFSLSRGTTGGPYLTLGIIAVTTIISILAFDQPDSGFLWQTLQLDKVALAQGEYWRLFSVTLLHGGFLHLFFNMYALYLAGALVEQLYGSVLFGLIYVVSAAAGSVGSFLLGGDVPSVGASGAIFGLFGVLLAATRTHHPLLDRRRQIVLSQIGGLIVVNLLLGFGMAGFGVGIDNAAHVGGLIAGLWLGFLLVPGGVPTLASAWRRPGGTGVGSPGLPLVVRWLGVMVLLLAILAGLAVGTAARRPQEAGGGGPLPVVLAGTTGMIRLTRAPRGTRFSATASPPWARASSRTIVSPSPPPAPVRAGSAR